jgi:hypothetical protein
MKRKLTTRTAVFVAVLLMSLLAASLTATAAPPGDNGPIIYINDGGVHTVASDGSGADLVAAGTFARPDVSFDGTAVLVTELSGTDTDGPLVSIDLATGAKTTVVATDVTAGVWSGDGNRVAYADADGIWVKELTYPAVQVSDVHSDVFDWSPVDDRLIVVRNVQAPPAFPEYYLETLDVETEAVVVIRDNGPGLFTWFAIDADFSPDGEDIVYSSVSPGSIEVVIHGQENDPLDSTNAWGGPNGYVSWSPDGTAVAYPTHVLNEAETEGVPVIAVHNVAADTRTVFNSDAEQVQWAPLPTEPVEDFEDVSEDNVFHADILWLADQGITRGCNPPDNTRFCPDDFVTRGQMAAFLVRALDYSDDGGGDLFTDDDGSVFEGDIDRLATADVTRGCNPPVNDNYCPDDLVTRAQMAAFLHRAIGG